MSSRLWQNARASPTTYQVATPRYLLRFFDTSYTVSTPFYPIPSHPIPSLPIPSHLTPERFSDFASTMFDIKGNKIEWKIEKDMVRHSYSVTGRDKLLSSLIWVPPRSSLNWPQKQRKRKRRNRTRARKMNRRRKRATKEK